MKNHQVFIEIIFDKVEMLSKTINFFGIGAIINFLIVKLYGF